MSNDHLILISGLSATGKSASLRNLRNQEKVLYLNCEAGKKLPFKNKFVSKTITDPYQIEEAFDYCIANLDKFDVIVIDTLTYLLDMFESIYIYRSANGQQAWADFQQYFKNLLQQKVAACPCKVVFLAHTKEEYDEAAMRMRVAVPVKGALKNNGIESYFSTVISTKKVTVKDLEKYKENNSMLQITEQDEMLGFKYVFQTQLTKETVGERIRGPMGMWSIPQTFIDNDVQAVLDHLDEYYG